MRLPETFSFACPLKIICGSHALAHLPLELVAVNAKAPFILANRDQVGKKRVNTVVTAFKTSGLTVGLYDRLPDSTDPDLMPLLVSMYRDGGCDSIVALGTGSVVDTAKFLNLIVSVAGRGQLDDTGKNSDDPGPLRPLMWVATAGGNGDESSGYACDGIRRLGSQRLVPTVAFIDPDMMEDDNDQEVAAGALLALGHAVEAFLDDSAGPVCRAYAHTAIALIMQYLPQVISGTDRKHSLCAVVNGQVAAGCAFFGAGPGLCHTLAIRLQPGTGLPLGFLMAVLLPHRVDAADAVHPDQVGDLLCPMVSPDGFAITAEDLKTCRIIALLWEFVDTLNTGLTIKIPSSLDAAGLTEDRIDHALSVMDRDFFDDEAFRVIEGARKGMTMMAG